MAQIKENFNKKINREYIQKITCSRSISDFLEKLVMEDIGGKKVFALVHGTVLQSYGSLTAICVVTALVCNFNSI